MDTKIGIVRQICSARHVFCQWLCAGAATDVGCGSPAAKIVATQKPTSCCHRIELDRARWTRARPLPGLLAAQCRVFSFCIAA